MSWLGDINLGDTIDAKFCTVSTTGAPTTLAGTPVVSAYVDNGTTQITAGITLTVDFDGVTGLHNVRVVASSGNGFATATNVQLVITTGTVGGTSVVGYVVAEFSIEKRSGLRPTVAARTLDVSAGGEAGLDWANIGSPTTAQGLSGTTVKTATDVETDTADIQTRLPAALVGGRMDANAGAVSGDATAADTLELFAEALDQATGQIDDGTFAAGAINAAAIAPDAIGSSELAASAVTEIQSSILSDATPFAGANVNATISSRATPAQVNAEVVDALATDTYAEPGQEAPPATTSLAVKISYGYKALRNKNTRTATQYNLFNDAGAVVDQKATLSDAAGTFTREEIVSGP